MYETIAVRQCATAEQVRQNAAAVRQRREAFFAKPVVARPKILPLAEPTPVVPESILVTYEPVPVSTEAPSDNPPKPQRPTMQAVMEAVCEVWFVPVNDILSGRRTVGIVAPRQIIFALCKALTLRSLPDIGRWCGNKDHSTVLHGARKYDWLIAELGRKLTVRDPVEIWAALAKELFDIRRAADAA